MRQPSARRGALALLTRVVYVVAFLLFDREAGRVRPSALTGLGVVALAVWSHLSLSGPWLQQAGLSAAAHPPVAAPAGPTSPVHWPAAPVARRLP